MPDYKFNIGDHVMLKADALEIALAARRDTEDGINYNYDVLCKVENIIIRDQYHWYSECVCDIEHEDYDCDSESCYCDAGSCEEGCTDRPQYIAYGMEGNFIGVLEEMIEPVDLDPHSIEIE